MKQGAPGKTDLFKKRVDIPSIIMPLYFISIEVLR